MGNLGTLAILKEKPGETDERLGNLGDPRGKHLRDLRNILEPWRSSRKNLETLKQDLGNLAIFEDRKVS